MTYVTIRVPEEEKNRWQKAASDRGMTMTAFLRVAVEEAIGIRNAKALASAIALELGPMLQAAPYPTPGPVAQLAREFDKTCDDVDFHTVGTRCSTCGGSKW